MWPTGFLNLLWSLMPDKCSKTECNRNGIRGNENVVDGKLVCDDCLSIDILKQRAKDQTNEQ